MTADLEPGEHLVRTHWSDGIVDRRLMTAGDASDTWILSPRESWSSPQSDDGTRSRGYDTWSPDLRPPEAGHAETGAFPGWLGHEQPRTRSADPPFMGARLALWRRSTIDRTWERVRVDEPGEAIDDGLRLELTAAEGLHVLEVRGQYERQFVSLPSEQAIVDIRRAAQGSPAEFHVDARTRDPDVEALRGYLLSGEIEVARALAAGVLAERLLAAKMAAPRIAALGAYVLLRTGELERLHNWPDNLTRWKPWLPDGPLIAAWQRLRSPHPHYDEVCELLLEAESRGMPVYTEGVRLLRDGLDLFRSDDEDWPVAEAVERVAGYAQALNWDKSETTYFGVAADQPRPLTSESRAQLMNG